MGQQETMTVAAEKETKGGAFRGCYELAQKWLANA